MNNKLWLMLIVYEDFRIALHRFSIHDDICHSAQDNCIVKSTKSSKSFVVEIKFSYKFFCWCVVDKRRCGSCIAKNAEELKRRVEYDG